MDEMWRKVTKISRLHQTYHLQISVIRRNPPLLRHYPLLPASASKADSFLIPPLPHGLCPGLIIEKPASSRRRLFRIQSVFGPGVHSCTGRDGILHTMNKVWKTRSRCLPIPLRSVILSAIVIHQAISQLLLLCKVTTTLRVADRLCVVFLPHIWSDVRAIGVNIARLTDVRSCSRPKC